VESHRESANNLEFRSIKNLKLLPLYCVYLPIFGMAAMSKWRELPHGAPEWFQKQFEGTFLNFFPGALTANFYLIALLETLVTLAFVTSLLRREFLPGRSKSVLTLSFFGAEVVFAMLGFGLRIAGDFHGAAELFAYFTLTLVVSRTITPVTHS
jgi:hypothetical protein